MEAFAAAFSICGKFGFVSLANVGHLDWAEQILKGFSWGHAFFKVNGALLEKYAKCRDVEGVVQVQDEWLARLKQEWVERREGKDDQDEWEGGNPNRLDHYVDSDDEEEDDQLSEEVDEAELQEDVDDDPPRGQRRRYDS